MEAIIKPARDTITHQRVRFTPADQIDDSGFKVDCYISQDGRIVVYDITMDRLSPYFGQLQKSRAARWAIMIDGKTVCYRNNYRHPSSIIRFLYASDAIKAALPRMKQLDKKRLQGSNSGAAT